MDIFEYILVFEMGRGPWAVGRGRLFPHALQKCESKNQIGLGNKNTVLSLYIVQLGYMHTFIIILVYHISPRFLILVFNCPSSFS